MSSRPSGSLPLRGFGGWGFALGRIPHSLSSEGGQGALEPPNWEQRGLQLQVETQGLGPRLSLSFPWDACTPKPSSACSRKPSLCFSVSFHRIYLCDDSSEREERRLPRVSAQQMLNPRESPFSLPLKLLSPFFPLASRF